mgnify:CR=1 FL=1
MCGITGIFAYRSDAAPVRQCELLNMREAMKDRGPDGAGLWLSQDQRIGFAHRRLSLIDLSESGSQPMATADGRFRIVFNGEIYNYRSLRAQLEQQGYHFRTHSDTEVLLHLYADKGREMVHDLRGMFAFALWDEAEQAVFLARDPFGMKPLYYADDGKALRFASQVKGLLAGKGIQTTPHPAGHVGFFLWGFVPEPYTLYRQIHSLPAGSSFWIDKHGKRQTSIYCNVCDLLRRVEPLEREGERKDIQQRLRTILCDSVQHHLIADVPVGVFLSSGLDSTTITALAAEMAPDRLQTVTLGFEEYRATARDETSLAEIVSRRYGTDHQTRWISLQAFQDDFERLLRSMDQPTVDGVNSYFVSKVVADSGLKTALSGLGGDELFGGYPGFKQIPQLVWMLSPLHSFRHLGRLFRRVSFAALKHFTSPKYAGLLEYGTNYGGAYLLRRGLFMPWELLTFLDGELVRHGWEELKTLDCLEETVRGIAFDQLKVSALEMSWYMRSQLLRDSDWAGMAHSLEIRMPLVDINLLKSLLPLLTTSFPPTKFDMACAPRIPLPDEILFRHKSGFNVPVQQWLLETSAWTHGERGLRGWAKTVYHAQIHNE